MPDDALLDPALFDQDPRGLQIADDPIAQHLQEVAILTRKSASRLGAALGINETDLAVMEQLITHGPLPPTELATRVGVTTAGITQVIDRLERAGHVTRERQTADKRRVLVRPVQASITQTYQQIAPMLQGLSGLLGALGEQERTIIEHFLGQVIAVYRDTLPTSAIAAHRGKDTP